MERTFVVIDEKTLECAVPVELNNTQEAILECKELREQIDQIAKNLQVCWDVKKYNNKSWAIVSKVIDVVNLDKQAHDVEMKAISFMNAISELTLPAFDTDKKELEKECPCHEEAEEMAEELDFVKSLKEDSDSIRGAFIAPMDMPLSLAVLLDAAWIISHETLMRMINAYLEKYEHE